MLIPISEAEKHLDDLVSRAEAGDEIVLTRLGRAVVRLVSLDALPLDDAARRAVLEAARARAREEATTAESAARSQDFLYTDGGLPG